MNKRRILCTLLALSLLAGPFAAARAAGSDDTADSRIGVLMAVACGLALKVVGVAPVPFAGIAAVTCAIAMIDAAMSP